MSRTTSASAARTLSFPRASGDEPRLPMVVIVRCLFSPRERG